jgi:hypothetical protein
MLSEAAVISAVETRNLMISLLLFSHEKQTHISERKAAVMIWLGTAFFLVRVMLIGR